MTSPIVGVDLSLSATGIARDDETGTIGADCGPERPSRRIDQIVTRMGVWLVGAKLVVIEGYSPGSIGIVGKLRVAELRGALYRRLFQLDIDHVEVPPATLKKWATGNGRASKDEMAAALPPGPCPANDNEVDAWFLWSMGNCAHVADRTALHGDLFPDRLNGAR